MTSNYLLFILFLYTIAGFEFSNKYNIEFVISGVTNILFIGANTEATYPPTHKTKTCRCIYIF